MTSTQDPAGAAADTHRCIICGAQTRAERMLHDDRYGYAGHFTLLRCPACAHCRLDVRMSDAQIAELYTRYYPRSTFDIDAWSPPGDATGLAAWWRGDRASAFRWVPPGVRVLDIGCGFGESLGYHRNRGCDAHGVEADANILRVGERHGLQVRHGLFDPRHYPPASFDVVTLDQVIEHLADPAQVLRGIHQVLKPGGQLVLSTPNANGWGTRLFGRRWIHWHAPYHLQFFSRASMARAASAAGFVLERRSTVTPAVWLDYQWGHLVAFPPEGQASPFWRPQLPRSLAQRIGLRLLRYVDRLGINAALTRLMDALRVGDNSLYVLRKRVA